MDRANLHRYSLQNAIIEGNINNFTIRTDAVRAEISNETVIFDHFTRLCVNIKKFNVIYI